MIKKIKKPNSFNYFSLIKEIALTDFKLRYKGSFLGYLWSLMKPIAMFAVLYIVFTSVFKIGDDVENFAVYLLLGIVFWEFFTETTNGSIDAIVSRGDLIRKIYFPRIVLVVSRIFTALLTLTMNLIAVSLFMIFTGVDFINANIIYLPLLAIQFIVLVMGIAFVLSSLFVRFRDIGHIWDVVTRALFYATPILYPLTLVPESFGKFLMLNPLAQILQDVRYILVTKESLRVSDFLAPQHLWIPYVLPFIIFIFGVWVYEKSASKFAENV